MFLELNIEDFILIHQTRVAFDAGLNILTGETGAGKSMVLGAIGILVGAPAGKDLVRAGCERARIEGVFEADAGVNSLLREMGIEPSEDVAVITREIHHQGRTVARVNGRAVTVQQLKQLGQVLVALHGQNEHQKLFDSGYQLMLLDGYGGHRLEAGVAQAYAALKKATQTIERLSAESDHRAREMDYLIFQIEAIEQVGLAPGEDAALEQEFQYLSHLETIFESVAGAVDVFSGTSEPGVLESLGGLRSVLENVSKYDQALEGFSTRLDEAYYILEELNRDMARFNDTQIPDEERLHEVSERLDAINALKLKYGGTVEDILRQLEAYREQKERYETLDAALAEARAQYALEHNRYLERSEALRGARVEAAAQMEAQVSEALRQLNMAHATFKIEVEPLEVPGPSGMDRVTFTISTNPGQPFRPLIKVVSGGELSRLMLAIKSVLGALDAIPTLIFDEIDAGISGFTAAVVGEKLCELSQSAQLICITHLPQIAAYGDRHFVIEKQVAHQCARTEITHIDGEAVESEISRLVGGTEITEATVQHARELLSAARKRKQ